MVNAIENARKAARQAQEILYEGYCTVYEYQSVKDPETKITHETEVPVIENQPCRLSFESLSAAVQTETAAEIAQGLKLFVSPELRINGGSKIVVTQNGVTGTYAASGEAAVYPTHQEIKLELFKEWA